MRTLALSVVGALALLPPLYPQDDDTQPPKEELIFPSLAPFTACRMWPVFRQITETEDGAPWPEDTIAKGLEFTVAMIQAYGAGLESTGLGELPEELVFGPTPSPEEYGRIQMIPLALLTLKPLWNLAEWDEADLATANRAREFFAEVKGSPELNFTEHDTESNQDQLEALVRWFNARMKDPKSYAMMIVSTDYGPWRPLPFEATEVLDSLQSIGVGNELQLSLRDATMEQPWVLQCTKGGELIWSTAITQVGLDGGLRFMDSRNPKKLGPYGWKVWMEFGIPQDMEAVILYLSPDGDLLFYFTTW